MQWKGRERTRCIPCSRTLTRDSKRRQTKRDPARRLFESARERARIKGEPFGLTVEDVRAVWPKDGTCPALGVRLRFGRGKLTDVSPTLDRLNNAWGYTPDNIAVLSYAANRAKGNMRARDLERIAAWMRARGLD